MPAGFDIAASGGVPGMPRSFVISTTAQTTGTIRMCLPNDLEPDGENPRIVYSRELTDPLEALSMALLDEPRIVHPVTTTISYASVCVNIEHLGSGNSRVIVSQRILGDLVSVPPGENVDIGPFRASDHHSSITATFSHITSAVNLRAREAEVPAGFQASLPTYLPLGFSGYPPYEPGRDAYLFEMVLEPRVSGLISGPVTVCAHFRYGDVFSSYQPRTNVRLVWWDAAGGAVVDITTRIVDPALQGGAEDQIAVCGQIPFFSETAGEIFGLAAGDMTFTPAGEIVVVNTSGSYGNNSYGSPIRATFDHVLTPGATYVRPSPAPTMPTGYSIAPPGTLGVAVRSVMITSSAETTGAAVVCVPFDLAIPEDRYAIVEFLGETMSSGIVHTPTFDFDHPLIDVANGGGPIASIPICARVSPPSAQTMTLVLAENTGWTNPGDNVVAYLEGGVTLRYGTVLSGGLTSVAITTTSAVTPLGFMVAGTYYFIETTAVFSGAIDISVPFDPLLDGELVRLYHYENSAWHDVSSGIDAIGHIVTGTVTSLSPFVVGIPLLRTRLFLPTVLAPN